MAAHPPSARRRTPVTAPRAPRRGRLAVGRKALRRSAAARDSVLSTASFSYPHDTVDSRTSTDAAHASFSRRDDGRGGTTRCSPPAAQHPELTCPRCAPRGGWRRARADAARRRRRPGRAGRGRVAQQAELLAAIDAIAQLDAHRPPRQVGVERVETLPHADPNGLPTSTRPERSTPAATSRTSSKLPGRPEADGVVADRRALVGAPPRAG